MRIIRCHIENFGKMHNIECGMNPGMNVLNAPNGWGKTTFAVFIRAMFYGMEPSKEADVFDPDDIRKNYYPRAGGVYGGYIIFEVNQKTYRLGRTFGKKQKEDRFLLVEEPSGKESSDYSANIGEELFGIDDRTYTRCTYIPQQAATFSSVESIDAYLLNLIESEDDVDNYGKAIDSLETVERRISRNGARSGRDADEAQKRKLAELEIELKKCRATSVNLTKWKDVLKEATQKKEDNRVALEKAEGELKSFTEKGIHGGNHVISLMFAVLAAVAGFALIVSGSVFQFQFANSSGPFSTVFDGVIVMIFAVIVFSFRKKWQKNVDEDLKRLQDEVDSGRKNYEVIFGEEEAIRHKIDELSKDAERVGSLADELEAMKKRVHTGKHRLTVIEKTEKYLEQARHNLKEQYLDRLRELFRQYVGEFDDTGKVLRAMDDAGQNGRYIENTGTGYSDLIAFSARFALIGTLFEGQQPFIVLDDPFVNLDDSKFRNTVKAVQRLSQRYQIIYLTCNGDRINNKK